MLSILGFPLFHGSVREQWQQAGCLPVTTAAQEYFNNGRVGGKGSVGVDNNCVN